MTRFPTCKALLHDVNGFVAFDNTIEADYFLLQYPSMTRVHVNGKF